MGLQFARKQMKLSQRCLALLVGLFLTFSSSAQFDFEPATEFEQFQGVWQVLKQRPLPLIIDEDAPIGSILVFSKDLTYLSGSIDPEYGASVDVQFSYQLKNGIYECILTGSNSMGYYMQHENQPFTFELFYSPDGKYLKVINQEDRVYVLGRLEDMNVNPSND